MHKQYEINLNKQGVLARQFWLIKVVFFHVITINYMLLVCIRYIISTVYRKK